VTKVLAFRGLERQPIDVGEAGDIVAIAGITDATVADTLCDPSTEAPLQAQPIDPPTLSMTCSASTMARSPARKATRSSPRDPRPPFEGSRAQHCDPGHRNRRQGCVRRCRAAASCNLAS
jgi:hypothetical protein